jgi:hypothetical protein
MSFGDESFNVVDYINSTIVSGLASNSGVKGGGEEGER